MDIKKQLKLFNILGGDIRLNIILYLASGEKCVCHIYKHLNLSQNLVSHHLGILRKNNIIIANKKGKWVYYSLNKKAIKNLRKFINQILCFKRRKEKCDV